MPQSRNEEYLENWRDGQTPTTAPQSRVEARLAHIAGYDVELEEPQSRVEELLAEVEAGLVPEPSGTVNITSNGTHGVAGYAEADVDVQPALEPLTVTQNGTYTPAASDGFDEVTVNYFYLLTGVDTDWNGNSYGWKDLSAVTVRQTPNGFILTLPPVVKLSENNL